MLKKVLQTNHSAARPAETRVRAILAAMVPVVPARCSTRCAQSAVSPVKFLLSLAVTVLFIAAIASEDKKVNFKNVRPFGGIFLMSKMLLREISAAFFVIVGLFFHHGCDGRTVNGT